MLSMVVAAADAAALGAADPPLGAVVAAPLGAADVVVPPHATIARLTMTRPTAALVVASRRLKTLPMWSSSKRLR
jgi:hypothetical protein